MGNKRGIVGLALALAVGLSGCQLAQPDQETAQADRLIGVYMTTEYLDLFDIEGYLEDHLNKVWPGGEITGDTSAYEGRVYAVRTESGNYVFEGVPDGVNAFWPLETEADGSLVHANACGPEVQGGADLFYGDEGTEQTCAVTLYLDARKGNAAYFNPVYQTAEGEVYLTAGTGISFYDEASTQAGGSFSQTLSAQTTVSDSTGKVQTDSFSVEATVEFWTPPDAIAITQMSGDGRVLRRDVFGGEELPDTLTKEPETVYYIVEECRTEWGETAVERTLEEEDCEAFSFVQSGEGAFCTPHTITLTAE